MLLVRINSSLLFFQDSELFQSLSRLLGFVELALPLTVLTMLIKHEQEILG